MIDALPPGWIFILGSLFIPVFKGRWKQAYLLLVAVVTSLDLFFLKSGIGWTFRFLNYDLVFLRVDRLSLSVGVIFVFIALMAILYSLHVKEDGQHMAAFLYIGSALGVVFAGDFFSLFVYWEIMAVTSVFLIWYQREKEALDAGFRYVLMHIFGGCCLLTGIILHVVSKGSITIGPLGGDDWASLFILVGFGLNTAFLPLHTWLPDAYPLGTVTGSIFLSVFTTKTGVYTLARCFPGNEFIAYMGGAMAVFGIVYALLQNDIRKLISYHIISQVGYMVAGIGVGSELGVNGAMAHLINNVLYKTLLFMCTGSVLYATGKRKLTELGGLAGMMPVTCVTCLVASLSITGAPGFNGFISKGMVISAASESHRGLLELLLWLASVGTFLSFAKLCYFTFFKKNEVVQAEETLPNMRWAMVLTALPCVVIGLYPSLLFSLLPYAGEYHPYTLSHVMGGVQLFLSAGLVFTIAIKAFSPHTWLVLDFDYFYRKAFRGIGWVCGPLNFLRLRIQASFSSMVDCIVCLSRNPFTLSERIGASRRINPGNAFCEKTLWSYNENIHRQPMGLGVLLAILYLFFYGLIYILVS